MPVRRITRRKSNCLNFKTVSKILCTKIVYPVKSNNSGKVCPHCPTEDDFPKLSLEKRRIAAATENFSNETNLLSNSTEFF